MKILKAVFKVQQENRLFKYPVTMQINDDRIEFLSAPFGLKGEIKAFAGARWHGFDKEKPRKIWSIDNSPRNIFQIRCLLGENPYEWFERPLEEIEYDRPLAPQQVDMVRRGITYHYQILAAEQGLGKSLAAIEILERSGFNNWWYVGPKSAMASVKLELKKWYLTGVTPELMTYDKLVSLLRYSLKDLNLPQGVIFDESSLLKTPTTNRAKAAQWLADHIRETHGTEGYVICLSGTPTAKHPTDVWSQAEITWPGFLREGSYMAFQDRYATIDRTKNDEGVSYVKLLGWKEDEVAKLPGRLEGLMTVYRKKDWLSLPEKKYESIRLTPSNKVMRVARTIANTAPNTITALTRLRSLSSGFQYAINKAGVKTCAVCKGSGIQEVPDEGICDGCLGSGYIDEYERETIRVKTPKDDALRELLDANEPHGRIVVAASFQGSIDRILDICKERGWAVACVDGRGWRSIDRMGNVDKSVEPLELWTYNKNKVAFVGNPGSCRYGLTLTEANTLVFYDNNFSAEQRLQMEDRIHRMGMDKVKGAKIVDLIHLPVDDLVIKTLRENKKLELLSLGVINESLGVGEMADFDETLE